MAEPIIIVKEGSLTVEVRERHEGTSDRGKTVLMVTIPGEFKFPGAILTGKKIGKSWVITWKKRRTKRGKKTER